MKTYILFFFALYSINFCFSQSYKSAFFNSYTLCINYYNDSKQCHEFDGVSYIKGVRIYPGKKIEVIIYNDGILSEVWNAEKFTVFDKEGVMAYKFMENDDMGILITMKQDFIITGVIQRLVKKGELFVMFLKPY